MVFSADLRLKALISKALIDFYAASHEVIPETHRNGHETPATLGLMLGFGVMMFLDTALG
ncbi:hypothetical protein PMO01_13125 [Pseudomonas moraviensis R28-S]|uniref:Uncharacterized protein n=1 Tax=Pseudomonas moraviensis R28-S TaxID=1395516 RepID=V8R921_9PSED|nr:hypothetical protein PMO01_13125 [Pseudomonas moraviensis R28-S]